MDNALTALYQAREGAAHTNRIRSGFGGCQEGNLWIKIGDELIISSSTANDASKKASRRRT